MERRLIAITALGCVVIGTALLVVAVAIHLSDALGFAALAAGATVLGWIGLVRTSAVRIVAWTLAALTLVGAVVVLLSGDIVGVGIAAIVFATLGLAFAKRAFAVRVHLPPAEPPRQPVMVYNPKSGGGSAAKANLAEEARLRGITPIELTPQTDLPTVLADAIEAGADGLMAAGGDGTQAQVAAVAAEHDLPFACIPAGTRNHFALDLGVDRKDVVGALDAFVDGGEKRVDLAEVNGHVFVNNVSIGVYADAVHQDSYRNAKIRTLLRTIVEALPGSGSGAASVPMSWIGADGQRQDDAPIVLVANNVYRLGRLIGSGTRPRLDEGVLGITTVGAADAAGRGRSLRKEWARPEFQIDAQGEVPIGLDGEAVALRAPLGFASRPGALRVRIARGHPGVSPSAGQPRGPVDGLRTLIGFALGRPDVPTRPAR